MDIRTQDWSNRYNGKGVVIPPAVEAFYKGELELFDDSLRNVEIEYPRLEVHVQDLRARIADPFMSHVILTMQNLPELEAQIRCLDGVLQPKRLEIDKFINDNSGKRLEDFPFYLAEEERLRGLKGLESEGEKVSNEHLQFYDKLSDAIINEDFAKSFIIAGNFQLVPDIARRNNVYRMVLNREDACRVLGADIKFLNRLSTVIANCNEERTKFYNNFIRQNPDLRALAGKTKKRWTFPKPLGRDEVSDRTFYEEVSPRLIQSGELKILGELVEGHFKRRVDSIWG